jgi:hypothetical protein
MRGIGLWAVVLVSLCSSASAQPAAERREPVVRAAKLLGAPPLYREFGDWVLVCDNVRTCIARYANARDNSNDGYLSVSRDAGPAGAIRVTLSEAAGGRLELDGRRTGRYGWTMVRGKGGSKRAVLESSAALKFVRQIKDGQELSYNAGGSLVSLSGLRAALSAMDEAQGRSGSETALVDIGVKPASAAPAAQPLPVVRAAPSRAVLAKPRAIAQAVRAAKQDELTRRDCDLDEADHDQAFAPDAGHVVVFLACDVGAYNLEGVLFIAPAGAPEKARLLVLPLEPGKAPADIPAKNVAVYDWNGNAPDMGWDAGTATFRTRVKARGRGDCGARSAWTFDGKDFQLSRYDKLESCGGGPDGDWPTLYRTHVVVK